MASEFVVIGDIHGCVQTTKVLIETIIQKGLGNRTFIFLGDYIDRGPNPKETVSYLIEFSRSHKCIFLRGNHEQMLLDFLNGQPIELWQKNGGQNTYRSYFNEKKRFELPYQHAHFYKNTRLFFNTSAYFFVHAGLDPEATIEESVENPELQEEFLWTREHLRVSNVTWEKTVVFGHTPVKQPIVKDKMIGIDTGCVYKHLPDLGKLCALVLPEEEFIYQSCLDFPKPY